MKNFKNGRRTALHAMLLTRITTKKFDTLRKFMQAALILIFLLSFTISSDAMKSYMELLPTELCAETLKYQIYTKHASANLVEKSTIITQHIQDVKKFVDAFPHLEGNIQFTQNITAFLVKRLRFYNMSAQKIVQTLSTSATRKEDMVTWLTTKERAQELANAISNGDFAAVIQAVAANPLLVHACTGGYEKTMLMKSVKHPAIVTFLLRAGADPDIKNYLGLSVLFICCNPIHTYDETVLALLKGHADPNLCNNEGLTPLIESTAPQRVKTVELLLQHGANPTIVTKESAGYPWKTALERAQYNIETHERNKDYEKAEALKEIIILLKKYGAQDRAPYLQILDLDIT